MLKIIAISLEQHPHIARATDGTRLAQRYAHPGDAEVLQKEHGDVLGEGFHQMKLGSFDKAQHALRDLFVIERVADGIGQGGLADIGADFDIDDDGLFDLPLPIENADDGLGLERVYEDFVH